MSTKDIIAIACADLHLSLEAPIARRGEKNWLDAQARQLKELNDLAAQLNVPILCAGDVFDHWKVSPELINWAYDNLPEMYAIAGQHDTPFHNMKDIGKSAYWTMVKVGKIHHLVDNMKVINYIGFTGLPWGGEIENYKAHTNTVVMVHEYLYNHKPPFDAPTTGNVRKGTRFVGWKAVISGDNHIPFQTKEVFNCGSFFNRKSDETHKPRVGLIHINGKVESYELQTPKCQVFNPTEVTPEVTINPELKDFLQTIRDLEADQLDYLGRLRQLSTMNTNSQEQQIINEAIEHANKK